MRDLFSSDSDLRLLGIPDAEIYLQALSQLADPAQVLLRQLIDSIPWRAEEVVVWGKRHSQPRLIAWFGDRGTNYTYSGVSLSPLPWTSLVDDIRRQVQSATNSIFNSVLLNYYRNHHDSMGFHSDDEPELGRRPTIASLSIGERRTLIFKHKSKEIKSISLPLESGSLLLMRGDTQINWKHGINKEIRPCGPRVNLTFRNILPNIEKAAIRK